MKFTSHTLPSFRSPDFTRAGSPGSSMGGMNGTSNGSKRSAGGNGNGHKTKVSASTPTFLRKVSSSDTPPNTWNRNDQVILAFFRARAKLFVSFFFFFIPFIILALLSLARSLPVVTEIWGHIADPSPPSHHGTCLLFYRGRNSALSSHRRLASMCGITPEVPGYRFCLEILWKYCDIPMYISTLIFRSPARKSTVPSIELSRYTEAIGG